ncbi:hypothetical protein TNCV_4497161 [Trichonephila clavipes]|nr:hypothetical protein TNCV_4497161 [Trichonephila clavipes]
MIGNVTPYHHTSCGQVCRCKAKAGLRHSPRGHHTRTRLSSLLRLNLDSFAKDDLFRSIQLQSSFLMRGTTPNGGVDGWASRAAHVMVPRSQMTFSQVPSCGSRRRRGP